ncbi:MAG TPA: hypothetical protein VKS60_02080 [Stellaceae bacterium]|nr:hypothetical protein [Stellaceae bacterium]
MADLQDIIALPERRRRRGGAPSIPPHRRGKPPTTARARQALRPKPRPSTAWLWHFESRRGEPGTGGLPIEETDARGVDRGMHRMPLHLFPVQLLETEAERLLHEVMANADVIREGRGGRTYLLLTADAELLDELAAFGAVRADLEDDNPAEVDDEPEVDDQGGGIEDEPHDPYEEDRPCAGSPEWDPDTGGAILADVEQGYWP